MGINVKFTVGVIVIIVVGFSASAYFFSMNPLGEFTDSISIVTVDKSKYIEKIDQCLSEQTVGGITLNSFTAKWAADFKEKNDDWLYRISRDYGARIELSADPALSLEQFQVEVLE